MMCVCGAEIGLPCALLAVSLKASPGRRAPRQSVVDETLVPRRVLLDAVKALLDPVASFLRLYHRDPRSGGITR